jgi:hypothetical protein
LQYYDYKTYIDDQNKNDQGEPNYIVYLNNLKKKNILYEIDMINVSFAIVIRKFLIENNETIRLGNIMIFDYQTLAMIIH